MHSRKPIPNPVVVLRKEFDDWAVLFNPDTAEAVGVNPVGVAVWELLDGKNSVEDIAARIESDFSDVPGTAALEIQTFLEDLTKRGFIGSKLDSAV
ncbi:MAG: SynChlorMet cassette protein ScmD [Desulfobulbales bacterium]|nr:SynChlorMet cassette protein ScmD [Desulfobulbales bacterium]